MAERVKIDHDAFKARVSDGLGSEALGREFGFSRTAARNYAERHGLSITGNRKQLPNTVKRAVEDMKPHDAIEYLLEVITQLCSGQDDRLVGEVMLHGFTSSEAQVLLCLFRDMISSKEMIYNALYAMRDENGSVEPKIIDVFVCKIRAKLRKKGWSCVINTIWGRGYRGERIDGFKFPWEQN